MKKFSLPLSFFVLASALYFAAGNNGAADSKLWVEKNQSEVEKSKDKAAIDAAALNRTFVDLAKAISPAVVNVYTKTRIAPRGGYAGGPGGMAPDDLFRFFFGNPFGGGPGGGMPNYPQEAQALGSGFVINSDGTIVTNSHVVRMDGHNADTIMIKFKDDPARSKGHEAKVIGVDEGTDVAVLRLKEKKKDIVVAPLGNSDKVQVGEWVIAIGNPYGHTSSVTKGIISALGRNIEESRSDFIQTDASINPGNSGGPLINLYGEVIGINTAIDARAQGIGFAIPINNAKSSVRQLLEKGEVTLGYIGVGISDVDPQVAKNLGLGENTEGALIQEVVPGEPADKAGVKSYDVVIEVGSKKISSSRDFMIDVGNLNPGTKAPLKVIRDGKTVVLTVTVGKKPKDAEIARRLGRGAPGGRGGNEKPTANTGLVLMDLTAELKRQLDLPAGANGAVIKRVLPGSVGGSLGLAPGDVITEVNRKPVHNARDAESILSKRADSFLLKIQRGQASIIASLDMNARPGEQGEGNDEGGE